MQLKVGEIVEGTVKSLTKFGAFVALDATTTGLVHISEVAHAYVSDIHDYLTEGQTVKVMVIGLENGKINVVKAQGRLQALRENHLTERHARALLRLEDPEQRLAAVEHIGKNQLNVADAEGYIDRLVAQNQTTQPRRRSAYIIKDVRLFLNSVDRGVRLMQTAGVGAKVSRRDTEDTICLTVTIPRAKPQKDVS